MNLFCSLHFPHSTLSSFSKMHTSPLRALLASVFLRTTATAPVYYPPNQYPLDGPDISPALQSKLDLAFQGPLYDYPTSFTQGIIPVCAGLSLFDLGCFLDRFPVSIYIS